MVADYFDKYVFLCEMYSEHNDEILDLVLNFFPYDNSVQVIDVKAAKTLLRRCQIPTIRLEMLQIGNIINVFSKVLLIRDCAPMTARQIFNQVQSTFALIKPVPPSVHGKILTYITKQGFRIVRMKNGKVSKEFAMHLYVHLTGDSIVPLIVDYITSGEVIGLELSAPDAVMKWRECLGASDPAKAAPGTLRHMFGENILKNIAHGCHTAEASSKMLELFFGKTNGSPNIPFRATYQNCTCCIILPHAIIDGNAGLIIERILTADKFYISAMAVFTVKLANALEFYEVYRGVVPKYEEMSQHLTEEKCIALEVKCIDPKLNSVCEFRKLCGPRDPVTDLCRQLYPDTIRALYGKSIVHNAVHCTDLSEDGAFEVEYFFKLLASE